jgi:hypothetical protein
MVLNTPTYVEREINGLGPKEAVKGAQLLVENKCFGFCHN